MHTVLTSYIHGRQNSMSAAVHLITVRIDSLQRAVCLLIVNGRMNKPNKPAQKEAGICLPCRMHKRSTSINGGHTGTLRCVELGKAFIETSKPSKTQPGYAYSEAGVIAS